MRLIQSLDTELVAHILNYKDNRAHSSQEEDLFFLFRSYYNVPSIYNFVV